jgi:hypothetical protein
MKMINTNKGRLIAFFLLIALTLTSWGEYWHFHKSNIKIVCESCSDYSNTTDLSFNQFSNNSVEQNICSLCNVIRNIENNYIISKIQAFKIEISNSLYDCINIEYFNFERNSVLNKSPPL